MSASATQAIVAHKYRNNTYCKYHLRAIRLWQLKSLFRIPIWELPNRGKQNRAVVAISREHANSVFASVQLKPEKNEPNKFTF